MSDASLVQRIDYEELTEELDIPSMLEGTSFESEFAEDEPLGKAVGGLVGMVLGRTIGAVLGARIADLLEGELLESNSDEEQTAGEDDAIDDESTQNGTDEHEKSTEEEGSDDES